MQTHIATLTHPLLKAFFRNPAHFHMNAVKSVAISQRCPHYVSFTLSLSLSLSLPLPLALTTLGILNRAATLKYIEFIIQPAGYHLIKSKSVYDPEILVAFINF